MKKIPEDIKRLGQKIEDVRRKEAVLRHETMDNEYGRASRIGLRIVADLLSAVLVGGAIGYLADEVFHTKPWLMSVFLFFGGAAGVLNVYRLSKQEDNHK